MKLTVDKPQHGDIRTVENFWLVCRAPTRTGFEWRFFERARVRQYFNGHDGRWENLKFVDEDEES